MKFSAPLQIEPASLATSFQERFAALQSLGASRRARFRLASRWFLRGHEAQNPVDKLLFWFICLEIFPAEGKTKVVTAVKNLISLNLYASLEINVLAKRLDIGRIHGLRSKIVHEGLSHIDIPSNLEFHAALQRLEAITTVCMRILAELPPGRELDKWVPLP